ncbi:hypothetical protein SISNIDRAFT_411523, partial [Sistotremastrum niveocremeum HHB9708]
MIPTENLTTDKAIVDKTKRPVRDHRVVRPDRSLEESCALAAFISVNGIKAHALFDTGCESTMMSQQFADVNKIELQEFSNPMPLQLAVKGSRSVVYYGSQAQVTHGPIDRKVQFDIINLDTYDVVFGVPSLLDIKANLNFEHETPIITIGGTNVDRALPPPIKVLRKIRALSRNKINPFMRQKTTEWINEYPDVFGPIPLKLPPLREINHQIPLIDENKKYHYHLPRCPDALKVELYEKIKKYTSAKWWIPKQVGQAAPMLCVFK